MPEGFANHIPPSRAGREALLILVGGMLGMVVAMGIGRFAFTPILPLMKRDLAMSNTMAGWLAGLNYLGYLAGALACSLRPGLLRKPLVTGGALAASIGSTLLMGVVTTPAWWGALRLAGGVASALLFIVISAEVAEALTKRGFGHRVGALYGGIGVGIALSGLAVPLLDRMGGWSGSWTGMGLLAAACAVVGVTLGRRPGLVGEVTVNSSPGAGRLLGIWPLAVAYFFEGLGYIVTATFLVAIIAGTSGLEPFAPYSWVAAGLAAVPSTILWPRLARRVGARPALLGAFALQAAGIAASIGAHTVGAVLFAAVAFGGTFLGIVALTLAEGNRRAPRDGRRATAILTVCFSLGQMLGPVLAGMIADSRDGFDLPLGLAAACIVIGGLFIAGDPAYRRGP